MNLKTKTQFIMTRLKFNWGYGIAALYLSFAAGIIFLVFKCTQHPVDLVSDDYYNREIKFQQQYDREENATQLNSVLGINVSKEESKLSLTFPVASGASTVNGKIFFMKPDDASMDKNISIAANSSHEQEIDYSQWKKGLYEMEVSWSDGVKEYFKQTFIQLN